MSEVHSPEPDPRKVRFEVPCPSCVKGILGWHIIGSDQSPVQPSFGQSCYCGTLLPRGFDLVRQEPRSRMMQFAPSARGGVRPSHKVTAPRYPAERVNEALNRCHIFTHFLGVVAWAPLVTMCPRCGSQQPINLPDDALTNW